MATKPPKPSLQDFASTRRAPGPACWACGLKEAAEIAAAYQGGVAGTAAIRAWLVEVCGYPANVATVCRVSHHLRNHVPRKKAA